MYITIWGEERPQGCQSAWAIPTQPTRGPPLFLRFFLQNPPPQLQNLSPELLKGFPLPQSAKEAALLLHHVVTRSEAGPKGGFVDEMQQYRMARWTADSHAMLEKFKFPPYPLQPRSCKANSYKINFSATTFKSLPCPAASHPAPRSSSPRAAPALLFPAAPTPPTAQGAAGAPLGCTTSMVIK